MYRSFALVQGKPVSLSLYFNSLPVPPVGMRLSKSWVYHTLTDDHQRQHLLDKCNDRFHGVDCTFLSRRWKLKLYEVHRYLPKITLRSNDYSTPHAITWVEHHLDPLTPSFLKKWSGLCKSNFTWVSRPPSY